MIALAWRAVELGVLAIALAVVLHVMLGAEAGSVVSGIAGNTVALMQKLPPGVVLGIAALFVIERIARRPKP